MQGCSQHKTEKRMEYTKLTPEEEQVIIHKGTEKPFTGKYEDFWEKGTYHCKQCDALLFESTAKFNASCGWPSFDEEIPDAVKRQVDSDGRRTEILCTNCDAHLGHIFEGEEYTKKNTRHCVNSISMVFHPEVREKLTDTAIFAGGCFWGVEYYLQRSPGVISVVSGYIGGRIENPSYEEVCSGTSGHYEAVQVTFDPAEISFEQLAKLFFEIHDPTQWNHQGPDVGEQYRSAIFYLNEEQKVITEQLIDTLTYKGYKIVTEVKPATTFWQAEPYHQDYYEQKGDFERRKEDIRVPEPKTGAFVGDARLAVNRDGTGKFQRVRPYEPIIRRGEKGTWDSGFIVASQPIERGDEIYLYYSAADEAAGASPNTAMWNVPIPIRTGLAKVRRDGFTWLQSRDALTPATVTTEPVRTGSSRAVDIAVNASQLCRFRDWIEVEVLDANSGKPIPGYTRQECGKISKEGIRVPVRWNSTGRIDLAHADRFKIRFRLYGRAKLYSFSLQQR